MPLMDVSTGRVIKEVQKQTVLWDSSHEEYRHKEARLKAWRNVICALLPEFPTMSAVERRDAERAIQQRWKTSRDAYMRCKGSLKAGTMKKKYFYYDYLEFLEKNDTSNSESAVVTSPPSSAYDPLSTLSGARNIVMKQERTESDSDNDYNEAEVDYNEEEHDYSENNFTQQIEINLSPQEDDEEEQRPKARKPIKRKLNTNGVNRQILKMCKDNSERMKNDNMSFFMSMLPIVNKFSDHQKLMFRSEVIRVAMEIRSQK